ncbi:Zinc finger, RING-type [Sesbania bispinosa]|nr:Zinc finger, RING-type [Sesbania bispinosa]
MANQPRINSALAHAICIAKKDDSNGRVNRPSRVPPYTNNQDKPDQPYMTDRAQRKGRANAASGKIFVTVPTDHFGPIPPENDPLHNKGLVVGESWPDRLECRQWGAHFLPIGGIAGQSNRGAQSVVLSGGYVDDEDHGEWFLYTGSGGKDLTGNKRTNKNHSFDQKFEKYNRALQISCQEGYPVRVVRSHKKKRSSYAPESGVRYDGIYRIEKCWQIAGQQGFKVCRFLFIRCDNEPAPWTRMKILVGNGRKPPPSRKKVQIEESTKIEKSSKGKRNFQKMSIKEQLRKGFSCQICKHVMDSPVTTPCGHNFCKSCLEGAFAGLKGVIESLKAKVEENGETLEASEDIDRLQENGVEETNKATDSVVKHNAKRKKIDSTKQFPEMSDDGKMNGGKEIKAEKVEDEENVSPLSPLNMSSNE